MKASIAEWRAALQDMPPGGIAVLSLAAGPPAGRRIARALLEEAAILGGGQVLAVPGGDLLLGSNAAPGHRAAQSIGVVTGHIPQCWPLPEGQAAAEAGCATAPRQAAASLGELEALCAARPIEELARLTFFAQAMGREAVAQRLHPAPLGLDDPELEALAREWQCRRLLAALTSPSERGRLPALRPGLRLILDLPLGGVVGGGIGGGAADGRIALLPLAALSDSAGFAVMATGLRQAGWALGLVAPDAAASGWVAMPGLVWALPAGPAALPHRPLIALGQPVPDWCRAPGILHEGIGA